MTPKENKLDKDQEKKLIEICKHVYNKNRFYWDEEVSKIVENPYKLYPTDIPTVDDSGMLIATLRHIDGVNTNSFKIHWLEFCLNILPTEIFQKEIGRYGQGHLIHHLNKMICGEWNPIFYIHKYLGLDKK